VPRLITAELLSQQREAKTAHEQDGTDESKKALDKANQSVADDAADPTPDPESVKTPTHEAPTDSNTVLSNSTQQMKDKVRGENIDADTKAMVKRGTMNSVTDLVSKYVWLVRNAGQWLIALAYTKAEAEAMAKDSGFEAESCTNVPVPILARGVAHGDMLLDEPRPVNVEDESEFLTHADPDEPTNMERATSFMPSSMKFA